MTVLLSETPANSFRFVLYLRQQLSRKSAQLHNRRSETPSSSPSVPFRSSADFPAADSNRPMFPSMKLENLSESPSDPKVRKETVVGRIRHHLPPRRVFHDGISPPGVHQLSSSHSVTSSALFGSSQSQQSQPQQQKQHLRHTSSGTLCFLVAGFDQIFLLFVGLCIAF